VWGLRVIQIGDNASARLMKREYLRAIVVEVGIEAVQRSGRVQHTSQTVYAGMVIRATTSRSGGPMDTGCPADR
jgi:hypothetical protein